MTTEQGNELIARFMGYKEGTGDYYGGMTDDKGSRTYPCFIAPDGQKHTHFYFHTSWDWLMPVVEKIEKTGCNSRIMGFEDEGSFLCDFVDSENREIACVSNYNVPKIQVVWDAVVQFIQWYNQQTEEN